jgi:hypothetical protein
MDRMSAGQIQIEETVMKDSSSLNEPAVVAGAASSGQMEIVRHGNV